MKSYEKRLTHRLILYRIMIALHLNLVFLIGELSHRGILLDARFMTQTAQSVSRLIVFGGMTVLFVLHHRTGQLLKDRMKSKEQQIRENDELSQYIHQQSNSLTLKLLRGGGVLTVLLLSYMDMTAFRTAYSLLISGLCLKAVTWAWYGHKVRQAR